MSFHVEQWDESTFFQRREEWTALVLDSSADPLFMSWEWLYNWWITYRQESSELSIYAVFQDRQLLALAPLYQETCWYFRGVIPVRRLQFLGKRFRGSAGIRSEYMSFIVRGDRLLEVFPLLLNSITQDARWHELVLEDMSVDGPLSSNAAQFLFEKGYYQRGEASGPTYVVDCRQPFADYLAGLGKNTRLRLYNRRKVLEELGSVSLESLSSTNADEFFHLLNTWHEQRWGKPIFNTDTLKFLAKVLTFEPSAITLASSTILKLDDQPISVLINGTAGGQLYNLQLGFIENLDKRISIGTMHLGYQLEAAFEDPATHQFDFLEGSGKNANYKSRLAQEGTLLQSSRWFRPLWMRLLFSFYDRFLRKVA